MKKLIFLMAILGIIGGSYAQNLASGDVPAAVVKAFNKANPKADLVEWNKTDEYFVASYKADNHGKSFTYDATGKLKQSEMQITISQLPTPALKYVNDNYPAEVVKKLSVITDAKGKLTYVVNLTVSDLAFDANGKYLNSSNEQKPG
jgi:uncharacterized protein YxeA